MKNIIVAEITKNWTLNTAGDRAGFSPGLPGTISEMFEQAITTNEGRGYELLDWKFSQVAFEGGGVPSMLTETIIATFRYVGK